MKPPILSFRDLDVWQSAMDLVLDVYKDSAVFPASERFGLTSQMRRASVSIPSNIAEGHARKNDGAYLNHIRIALGSQAELGTQVEIAERLGYLSTARSTALLDDITRTRQMLHGVRRSLERKRGVLLTSAVVVWLLATASLVA